MGGGGGGSVCCDLGSCYGVKRVVVSTDGTETVAFLKLVSTTRPFFSLSAAPVVAKPVFLFFCDFFLFWSSSQVFNVFVFHVQV